MRYSRVVGAFVYCIGGVLLYMPMAHGAGEHDAGALPTLIRSLLQCEENALEATADIVKALINNNPHDPALKNEKGEGPLTQLMWAIKYMSYKYPYYHKKTNRVQAGNGSTVVSSNLDQRGQKLLEIFSYILSNSTSLEQISVGEKQLSPL